VANERTKLNDDLEELQQAIISKYDSEINELQSEYAEIRSDFSARMASHNRRLQEVFSAIKTDLNNSAPDISNYPLPEPPQADEAEGDLFVSHRPYLHQLAMYKEFQGKEMAA
jgi:hypothetical protein